MFKNIKIGKKLIISFVAVVVVASIASMVGLFCLINVDKEYSKALVTNGFTQGDIGAFNTYVNKGAALVRDIIFLTDDAEIANAQTEFNETTALVDEYMVKVVEGCQTPDEVALIANINANLEEYRTARTTVIELGLANKNEEAISMFRDEVRPVLAKVISGAEELRDLNVSIGEGVSTNLTNQTNVIIVIIVAIIIAAIVISLLIATFISNGISRPINACVKRLVELSNGDLSTEVPHTTAKDETGVMLNALKATVDRLKSIIYDIGHNLGEVANGNLQIESNAEYNGDFIALQKSLVTIVSSLNDTLTQINQASDEVSSGAEQVSSGAQELSQGATEQASSVEELAATITEISQQVKVNAESAVSASRMVDTVGNQVVDSNAQMQKLIVAMREISSTSSEISKIIKTIEDIAFQTNILALNAAVEAARAGSAGKGFAVVADEVRNLASKSSEAAKNTTALIEGSIAAVENGTHLADETAKSLTSVVEGTQNVTSVIDKISLASNEQANSIGQVTQGVDQISSVVQNNSATAEESAAASEELSGQASMLKSLVSRFKLRKSGEGSNLSNYIS